MIWKYPLDSRMDGPTTGMVKVGEFDGQDVFGKNRTQASMKLPYALKSVANSPLHRARLVLRLAVHETLHHGI